MTIPYITFFPRRGSAILRHPYSLYNGKAEFHLFHTIAPPRRQAAMVADFYGGIDSVGEVFGYVAVSLEKPANGWVKFLRPLIWQ